MGILGLDRFVPNWERIKQYLTTTDHFHPISHSPPIFSPHGAYELN